MHLVWDSGFFLLFFVPAPPSSLADLAKNNLKSLISNTQYEKYLNAKSSLKQIQGANFISFLIKQIAK